MTGPILNGRSQDDYPLTLTSIVERAERFHADREVVSRRHCNLPDRAAAHFATDFAKWQLPDRSEFVAAIPCRATGKFKKIELRRQFT